jgi:hypothetical protein
MTIAGRRRANASTSAQNRRRTDRPTARGTILLILILINILINTLINIFILIIILINLILIHNVQFWRRRRYVLDRSLADDWIKKEGTPRRGQQHSDAFLRASTHFSNDPSLAFHVLYYFGTKGVG